MARSDLLLSLVRAGTVGDALRFRKTVEALIAEERAKKHEVLAGQLAEQLNFSSGSYAKATTINNGYSEKGAPSSPENGVSSRVPLSVQDLFFEMVPKRTMADLVLSDLVQTTFRELVEEHHRQELLRSYNLQPRHRVLLTGAPGNGKTSLAEALAHALSVPLIVARYEGLIASYLGETAGRLRRLFEHVRSRACVLFFDEFDTLGKERGDTHETGEIKRVVSSLLLQIDDLPSHVVVVTATNHPELLDRAVWRRFQIRVELRPPEQAQIEEFFARFIQDLGQPIGMAPRTLARNMKGASYSDLREFVSDVARRYVLTLPTNNMKGIVQQCLTQWQQRVMQPTTE
jgi:SpoVK/Ycf46/Vps4 family AAA+-type ATPase